MAKAISDQELQLKKRARRRLVGAVALVLLIVVFLPMILDSEPKPLNQDITITIPPIPKPESIQQTPAPAPAISSTPAASSPRVAGMPTAPVVQPDPALAQEAKHCAGQARSHTEARAKARDQARASQPRRRRGTLCCPAWRVFECSQRQGTAKEIAGKQVQGLYRTGKKRGRRPYASAGGALPESRCRRGGA
jgi:cell division septation protein DedD